MTSNPTASAPRLYMESLNDTIDLQESKVAGLNNRVPSPVLVLSVLGSALALALLALYVALVGRGTVFGVLCSARPFDLDGRRGVFTVPDKPLTDLWAEEALPPAFAGPAAQ